MKSLFLITFLIVNCYACSSFEPDESDNTGGILIIFNDVSSTTSLKILGTSLEIKSSQKRFVHVLDLIAGDYTLIVETNGNKKTVRNIYVSADTFSVVPLYYFEENLQDTISWKETEFKKIENFSSIGIPHKMEISGAIPTSCMTGTVKGHLGSLEGANVFLQNYPWWRAETDSEGNYCIADILSGRFTVKVIPKGHLYQSRKILDVKLSPDSTSFLDIILDGINMEKPVFPIRAGVLEKEVGDCENNK